MVTTINGVERYAQNFTDTTDPGNDNVYDRGAVVNADLPATGAATVEYHFVAPYDGVLKFAYVAADVTSDATATYTVDIDNVTKSAAMVNAVVFGADPVLTAGTRAALTLSTTEADLAVSEGDVIKVTVAGGTGAGDATVQMAFAWS